MVVDRITGRDVGLLAAGLFCLGIGWWIALRDNPVRIAPVVIFETVGLVSFGLVAFDLWTRRDR